MKDDELFHNELGPGAILQERTVAKAEMDSILKALGGSARTEQQRCEGFLSSLPKEAKTALNHLRMLAGAETIVDLFSCDPAKLDEMRNSINKIDLRRLWKVYETA